MTEGRISMTVILMRMTGSHLRITRLRRDLIGAWLRMTKAADYTIAVRQWINGVTVKMTAVPLMLNAIPLTQSEVIHGGIEVMLAQILVR
jgi:hypothetical protein